MWSKHAVKLTLHIKSKNCTYSQKKKNVLRAIGTKILIIATTWAFLLILYFGENNIDKVTHNDDGMIRRKRHHQFHCNAKQIKKK